MAWPIRVSQSYNSVNHYNMTKQKTIHKIQFSSILGVLLRVQVYTKLEDKDSPRKPKIELTARDDIKD